VAFLNKKSLGALGFLSGLARGLNERAERQQAQQLAALQLLGQSGRFDVGPATQEQLRPAGLLQRLAGTPYQPLQAGNIQAPVVNLGGFPLTAQPKPTLAETPPALLEALGLSPQTEEERQALRRIVAPEGTALYTQIGKAREARATRKEMAVTKMAEGLRKRAEGLIGPERVKAETAIAVAESHDNPDEALAFLRVLSPQIFPRPTPLTETGKTLRDIENFEATVAQDDPRYEVGMKRLLKDLEKDETAFTSLSDIALASEVGATDRPSAIEALKDPAKRARYFALQKEMRQQLVTIQQPPATPVGAIEEISKQQNTEQQMDALLALHQQTGGQFLRGTYGKQARGLIRDALGALGIRKRDPEEADLQTRLGELNLELRKLYIGTAQTIQELANAEAGIPHIKMQDPNFEAAVTRAKERARQGYQRIQLNLRTYGYRVPPIAGMPQEIANADPQTRRQWLVQQGIDPKIATEYVIYSDTLNAVPQRFPAGQAPTQPPFVVLPGGGR